MDPCHRQATSRFDLPFKYLSMRERSGVKVDGPRGFEWTVQRTESERSLDSNTPFNAFSDWSSECEQAVYFRVHLFQPSTLDMTRVDVFESLRKLYSRALLLAVDFEFEHGVNYLLNNKKNFFNITDLTSELILLDEVSI